MIKKYGIIFSLFLVLFLYGCNDNDSKELPRYNVDMVSTSQDEVIFNIDLIDPDEIVTNMIIVLYKDNEQVDEITTDNGIIVGDNENLKFSNLTSYTEYSIRVVLIYTIDGNEITANEEGMISYFETSGAFDGKIENIVMDKDEITFDINIKFEEVSIRKMIVNLYNDNRVVSQIEIDDGNNMGLYESLSFSNLLPNEDYEMKLKIYYNDMNGNIDTYQFSTGDYEVNVLGDISNPINENNKIIFDVNLDDVYNVAQSISVVLIRDNIVVQKITIKDALNAGYNDSLSFSYLLKNTSYTIELSAVYYNGSSNVSIVLDSYEFNTGFWVYTPNGEISEIEINENSINFDLLLEDYDKILDELSVVLLSNGNTIDEKSLRDELFLGLNSDVSFQCLNPNTTYTIEIRAVYNIGDGNVSMVLDSYEFSTTSFPTGDISNILLDGDIIIFDLEVLERGFEVLNLTVILTDGFNTIELTLEDGLLLNELNENIMFWGLEPNRNYELSVNIDYKDGNYIHSNVLIGIHKFTTDDWVRVPTGEISNVSVNGNLIEFDLNVNDPDQVIEDLSVVLIYDGVVIAEITEAIGLEVGLNSGLYFYNLPPNADYTIQVRATYDDGNEIIPLILDIYELSIEFLPTFEIGNIVIEENSILLDVLVLDQGYDITSLTIAVVGEFDMAVLTLEDGLLINEVNQGTLFYGLSSNADYVLLILVDYSDENYIYKDVLIGMYEFTT